MKYEQPPAPNAPPKAATALEMAIYNFEKKCDEYHAKKCVPPVTKETPEQQEKRIKEWSEARDFLERERLKINTLASMEAGLAKYRTELGILTSSERLERMRKEKHHPTKVLAKHMTAEGEPKPSKQHAAHHIIPGKGRWMQDRMTDIRLRMHLSGIRINDPRNGVWLPSTKDSKGHWATPDSPTHKSIHGINYETWLTARLNRVPTGAVFETKLKTIKLNIKNGTYPIKIEQAKDSSWNGR